MFDRDKDYMFLTFCYIRGTKDNVLNKEKKYVFSFLFRILFMRLKNDIEISYLEKNQQHRLKSDIENI